ncbi:Multidrug resistance regulator 1 [Cyberlindnera fabianii]|uniref:Multidrug resistance regulator 1 n=1 Tax=Cyberlindnera fabianii TaxID=36022 RepID=A0A1V2LDN1_CYBFA|nr:Multidrug resistance regulator 1 [Cyberlindnera fabianii]
MEFDYDSSKNKKTRFRVPTVCTVCRRRKIKCDKERPHCLSCIKNKTTHLCHYEEQPWAGDNEVQKLKDQVFQLQHQNNELKNLLSKKSSLPSTENTGLILPDDPANDPVLELTKNFDLLMLKENKMSHYGSSSYMAVVSQDPVLSNIFKRFLHAQNWGINLEKYFLYDQGILPLADHGCGSLAPNVQGSVFEADLNKNHEQLVQQINEALPEKNVLHALIDHFFAETYAFIPYIDEDAFRKNVESLVSFSSKGKSVLVVTSVAQLVTVATVLVVLRFAYLSLPMDKSHREHNHVITTILESHVQIPPSFIEFSKACIANASALRKPSLKHIQALLLLRLYRFYAPEDGDEGTDSTIFLSLIVQMAKMHGLHRDPSRFAAVRDHATINIWRKIWLQIMYLDASQALMFGCPLLIDDEYDTELPVATSADNAMEKSCIESLVKLNEVTTIIRSLIKLSLQIREPAKRSDYEKHLRDAEFLLQKYRPISDLTHMANPTETFLSRTMKVKDICLKLTLYNVYSVYNYILMLTCEPTDFLAQQKYTMKATESCFITFRLCHQYAQDPQRFMKGLNFEVFLSAPLFELAKRGLQQVVSLCFRDMSGMLNLKKIVEGFTFDDSYGIVEWLTSVNDKLTISDHGILRLEEFIQSCSKLANRYFVCWRLVFINKLFEDYIEQQYPGKFEELHQVISSMGSKSESTLSPAKFDASAKANDLNTEANEVFQQLVDRANVSKFDYLTPDFDRFEGFGEPFYDNFNFTGNFESFDSLFAGAGAQSSFGSFSTNNGNNSDDVSPRTDDSDTPSKSSAPGTMSSVPLGCSSAGPLDGGFNIDKTIGTPDLLIDPQDEDLAMQVARSMFGGSTKDVFGL